MSYTFRRVYWSSESAFVFATAAAAVGLGNIWRFPYLAGENGGGAFIIAYIIAVITMGVPLMVLEISAGRAERGSPVRTFRRILKRAAPIGWLVVILTLIIMSYYLVITGWTLGFAVESLKGNLVSFSDFTDSYASLWYFLAVVAITSLVVAKGVKTIEWLSKIMMPALIAVILLLTFYSLTLEGRGEALSFLFNPDLSDFLNPTLWLLAFGQAFYSLAVGQGYLITYGSFMKKGINLPRSAGWVAGIETSIALIAVIMLFPIVFTFGLDPAEGTELAFTTLPLAFKAISFGSILAMFFFSLFFLAAISSCIAGMEVVKTAVREEFGLSEIKATGASFLALLPLGVLAALSFTPMDLSVVGRPFLEILDMFAANQIVVTSGIVGGAIISWSISRHDLVEGFGTRWKKLAHTTVIVVRFLPVPVSVLLILVWLF
ncbi:MAG: sodium-dependent transporter [Patescibacteria group bacterium]